MTELRSSAQTWIVMIKTGDTYHTMATFADYASASKVLEDQGFAHVGKAGIFEQFEKVIARIAGHTWLAEASIHPLAIWAQVRPPEQDADGSGNIPTT